MPLWAIQMQQQLINIQNTITANHQIAMANNRAALRRSDEQSIRQWNALSSKPQDILRPLMHYNDNDEPVEMPEGLVFPGTIANFRDMNGPELTALLQYFNIAPIPHAVDQRRELLIRHLGTRRIYHTDEYQ
jgi:hypothetical protein